MALTKTTELDKMEKPIVYRTENKVNGKFYYGVHNGKKPHYVGSGTALMKAINKYGKNNFIRRTIKEFDTMEEAYAFERLVVGAVMDNPMCYNIAIGGEGGHKRGYLKSWNKGKTNVYSEETLKRMSESAIRNRGKGSKNEKAREISKELGVPFGTVLTWLSRDRMCCIKKTNQQAYNEFVKKYKK